MSLSVRWALPGLQNDRRLWSSYQAIICYQFGANPLPDPMRVYCQWNHLEYISVESEWKIMYFITYGVCKTMPILPNSWRHCRYYHHDDVIKCIFSALLALCDGKSPSSANSPDKGQWGGDLKLSLSCAWTIGWANHWDAGDLRNHRAHFNVTVMAIVTLNACVR